MGALSIKVVHFSKNNKLVVVSSLVSHFMEQIYSVTLLTIHFFRTILFVFEFPTAAIRRLITGRFTLDTVHYVIF